MLFSLSLIQAEEGNIEYKVSFMKVCLPAGYLVEDG